MCRISLGLISLALAIAGCGGFGFTYEKNLIGIYFLTATDEMEQMSLSQKESSNSYNGIISETVFGVGWTNDWIIAEQHPREFPKPPDKSKTNFYILRVSDGKLFGPLSAFEFDTQRKENEVPSSLQFSLIFDQLK
jgi:hypothetical protein